MGYTEASNVTEKHAASRESLDVATGIVQNTRAWAQKFHNSSAQRATAVGPNFSAEGALSLPYGVPRPRLRITPRVYDVKHYSDFPYVKGYVRKDPLGADVFTPESDLAWYGEVPLFVDPTRLNLKEYALAASKADPLVTAGQSSEQEPSRRRVLQQWHRYQGYTDPYKSYGTSPGVYRALGVLPPLPRLSQGAYAYDLRLDVVLGDVEGLPAPSLYDYNYANTDWQSADSHHFDTPRNIARGQAHLPSYEMRPPGFYPEDAASRGWPKPPGDYHAALLFPSSNEAGTPAILTVHLAGASAVGQAVEQP